MKHPLVFALLLTLISCAAQTPVIVEKTKIDWNDYPGVFTDATKTEFKKHLAFFANVDMYEVTYLSDGLKIQSFAAVPKAAGEHPVIIYNRGGNRDFGALQLLREKYKYPAAYQFSKLANEGYVVIGCNYRGCGDSEGEDEFGGRDVNDVLNLIEAVKEIPKADETRIGMYGWSRGGMMTYLTLPRTTSIKAAVVGGAPSDKRIIERPDMETNVYAELIPKYWDNKEAELKKRSAVLFADKFPADVPILILHGDADVKVKSAHAENMALAFDKYGIPYRLKIFEGGDHGLSQFRAERDQDVLDWFNLYLKNGTAFPDTKLQKN
ncbi:MAG: alpha/beta hydrolase family protein [Saprospiraceae bacterium]